MFIKIKKPGITKISVPKGAGGNTPDEAAEKAAAKEKQNCGGNKTVFDTMKIAKNIKQARINKNLTQMNLADAMGISYQAVSNWERGNSMPDIGKLEELCNVLEISVEELLGMEKSETETVKKAMGGSEPLTMEELSEVAVALSPEQVKERAEKAKSGEKKVLNLSAIENIAPFMDEDDLYELIEGFELGDISGLGDVAPFLPQKAFAKFVSEAKTEDLDILADTAPYMGDEELDALACRCVREGRADIIADFGFSLPDGTFAKLISSAKPEDFDIFTDFACSMDDEELDALAFRCVEEERADMLSHLAPFISSKTLKVIAKKLMQKGDLETLEDVMPFV